MTKDEIAFYDALEVNDSAVKILSDQILKQIAQDLERTLRNNLTIDWTARESVRAHLRVIIKKLLRGGQPLGGGLLWQGVLCDLGITEIHVLDPSRGIRMGPHRVVAKFAHQRLPPGLENAAIIGMNFLADNNLRLELEGNLGVMTGMLAPTGP